MDYTNVDNLMDAWNRLEALVKRMLIKVDGCPLSTQRISVHVRLMFCDRPLAECKAQEKVEAAKYVEQFVESYKKARQELSEDAEHAVGVVNAAVDYLTELEAVACNRN